MAKNILIISYVPVYNRQGFDLNDTLNANGVKATLVQSGARTDKMRHICGFDLAVASKRNHIIPMLKNMFNFLRLTLFKKKDVVVCLGRTILIFGAVYKKLFGCKLVYYSLEYGALKNWEKKILQSSVDAYIDVEENRLKRVVEDLSLKIPGMVVYNMPRKHTIAPKGGKLREAVNANKIVIYAGSKQKYSCLENIVESAKLLDRDIHVVIMAYGYSYDRVLPENCHILQTVSGEAFYDWLTDADVALLPYEDESDFNVMNCSPQKIFDCFLAGVPFLGSKRPVIEKVLSENPTIGAVCDFTSSQAIADGIRAALSLDKSKCATLMHRLHLDKYNIDVIGRELKDFISE